MNPMLNVALLEIERHVAGDGWDRPPMLYALVDTAELARAEPGMAEALSAAGQPPAAVAPGSLTPVEQEQLPDAESLDAALARIAWGPKVVGCALSVERLMLPPSAESELPSEDTAMASAAARHPAREDVRIVVGVLRDGSVDTALRMRSHDSEDAVVTGPDLVPALAEALAATLAP